MLPYVVGVKCIYEQYIFSHSVAMLSAECNRCNPLQLGLWTAVDNMSHCLAFATRAHVSCYKAPLLSTGCAVALFGPEAIQQCPVAYGLVESWLPDSEVMHWSGIDHRSRLSFILSLRDDVCWVSVCPEGPA